MKLYLIVTFLKLSLIDDKNCWFINEADGGVLDRGVM